MPMLPGMLASSQVRSMATLPPLPPKPIPKRERKPLVSHTPTQTHISELPKSTAPVKKLPLRFFGLLGNVVHKLFNEAKASNKLDDVNRDLRAFLQFAEDPRARFSLTSPALTMPTKQTNFKSVASKLGLCDLTEKVAGELLALNRLSLADVRQLQQNFRKLVKEHRNEVDAIISSADPLSDRQLRAIESKVKRLLSPGQQLVLSSTLDARLLGGIKVRIDERELDLSVATKIRQFERSLKAAGAAAPPS